MDRIRIGYPAGYLRFFRIRIGFGYSFLKNIGPGQDQDICLISVTKFSWQWFKMSQMMVAVFFLLWFYIHNKSKWFCQYVLHSSQSMIIHVTSSHGRNFVGSRGTCPPTFSDGGDIICHAPPFFLFRLYIWRGFKNKSDVCHVLCEELFMLGGRLYIA